MKNYKLNLLFLIALFVINNAYSQNPIVRNQFTADPTARVFGDKVYLFPSHDILAPPNKKLRKDWFCMADYHVFSSGNLTEWTDHGVIVSQDKVKWVDSTSYSMWAPDCIERNGKYYFYFPSNTNLGRRGFGIGVAIADKPEGPYIPENEPIKKLFGIDPNVFIDKDGQAYLYWSMGNIFVAKLKENMTELASETQSIANLPSKGMKEGPFLFERNGIYYLTFPHVENKTERLEYAMGTSPTGPFKMTGVIMDESPTGCWTNHHSFINFKGQWYLFYHDKDLSPKFDKNRSARIDSLFFNADGTIKKVIPTLRGVGLSEASKEIQIDRYSKISEKGVTVNFIDTLNTFGGWKATFNETDSWLQYNAVNFNNQKFKNVVIRAKSENGGVIELKFDNDKDIKAKINVPKQSDWQTIKVPVKKIKSGNYNIVLKLLSGSKVEVDWIKFE